MDGPLHLPSSGQRLPAAGPPAGGVAGAGADPADPFAGAEEAFARLEALGHRHAPDASDLERLAEPAQAVIPCPRCEALEVVPLPPGGPLRAARCGRCGAPIDPGEPFPLRARSLGEVIRGTTATLVLVLARTRHPLAALPEVMGAGLRAARGAFVVGVVDTALEPEAPRLLDLDGANAIAFYLRGERLGALTLPGGLEDLAARGRRLFDFVAGAATGQGLAFPFAGGALPLGLAALMGGGAAGPGDDAASAEGPAEGARS